MKQSANRFGYIDALRGLAATWVLTYHIWNRFYPGLTPGVPNALGQIATTLPADPVTAVGVVMVGFGFTGVTLFFVLSGFCIHLPQARRNDYQIVLPDFARRRFWRLYPAYLASIAFAVLVLLLPKVLLAVTRGHALEWWTESHVMDAMVNAAFLQQIWPAALGINGVYWTLVYEVQFYIAYPALLWCIRRTGFATVGFALLAAELWLSFTPSSIPMFFLSRYFEWYLGVLAAEAVVRRPTWLRTEAAVMCAILGLTSGAMVAFHPVLHSISNLLFAIGFCGVVLSLGMSRGRVLAILDWRVLATLGAFSYSLYLVHVPVIDLIWNGLDRLVAINSTHPAAVHRLALVAIPISLVIAYGCYRTFELPYLRPPGRPAVPEAAVGLATD